VKKVLVVSYHFPPSRAVGAVRPSKFVHYLPKFGWEPTVLSVNTREIAAESETPSICRVTEWPHPLKSYERFMLQRARRKGEEDTLIAKITVSHSVATAPDRRDLRNLKRWVLSFFWLPDWEVGWLAPAIWRGRQLIRKNRITHIVTTGPPFTCHLVGLALKRLTRIRWVADFRDPWSLDDKFPIFRNQTTDSIESRLIRSVMGNADLVLSVTPQMTERARKEHADLDPSKFVTLTSGFDPADFIGLPTVTPSGGPIIFSYLGSFYHGRTPEPFLRALRSLIADGAVKGSDVRVKLVGQVARAEGQSVQEMVRQLGLEDNVSVTSAVPRREALQLTAESDVVLVLDEQHPVQIPFKLYDAMAVGAVIFNVGSRGAVSEVLARTGRGISVDYRNLSEIRNGILECIRRRGSAQNRPEPWRDASIQEFNFQHLTGRLAALLEGLA
jgi:glycosyltransferase involved in cell wall biosynthesis